MKNMISILLTIILSGCSREKEIEIFKQWHLAPRINTLDIALSKNLKQYQNQYNIYTEVKNRLEEDAARPLIAEGCEGDIREEFSKKEYNGWTLAKLEKYKGREEFADIMAPIPMKIMVEFPSANVICGDSDRLIKLNQLAFSDARGFSGFYQKLKEFSKNNQKKYKVYLEQLTSLFPDVDKERPLKFTLNKSLGAISDIESYIVKRNESFFQHIKKNKNKAPMLVVGGLHIKDLKKRISKENMKASYITPKGYVDDEVKLFSLLRSILKAESKKKISLFQVPEGFLLANYKIQNLISLDKLFSKTELTNIKKVLAETDINLKLLQSDFDGDGVRDFTISTSKELIVLSAEDSDWDNDGVSNIIDSTLGSIKIGNIVYEKNISNKYKLSDRVDTILNSLAARNIKTIFSKRDTHKLIVLKILGEILDAGYFPKTELRYIRAVSPIFNYGRNVFFSYVKQSSTLEYYPEELEKHIQNIYQKRFRGVPFEKFINHYYLPLITHSLSHEIGHSYGSNLDKITKQNKWTWTETPYTGLYLKSFRQKNKEIVSIKSNFLYRGKSREEWNRLYKRYIEYVNSGLKKFKNNKDYINYAKASTFFTKSTSKQRVHQLSFLQYAKLPSLYGASSPDEWYAEMISMCIYKKVFQNSHKLERSIELEQLLGINPGAASKEICTLVI